jgi:hypothetical protein
MRRRKILSTLVLCTPMLISFFALLCGNTMIMGVDAGSGVHLSVSLHDQGALQKAPSCHHTFASINIVNTVCLCFVFLNHIQYFEFV